MEKRKEVSTYQYPYPAEPRNWSEDERQYGRGLRRLFDILFSRKLQNVMIADKAITARNIDAGAVHLYHLREGFGTELDISENQAVTGLTDAAGAAQDTADTAVGAAADAQTAAADAQTTADTAASAASAAQDTANTAVSAAADAQATADRAVQAAATAQRTADGLTNLLMPVGITIIAAASPTWGTWTQTTVDTLTAWTRTA